MAWYTRLLNLVRGDRLADDIRREMAFHLAEREDDLVSGGMPERDARHEARRRFGNVGIQRERTRDVDVLGWLDTLVGDVRYAARTLRASPGYTLVAVLSLALGIGANTAIFSLIDAVMLRSLPVRHPEELVVVVPAAPGTGATEGRTDRTPGSSVGIYTYPLWEAIRDGQDAFSGAAAFGNAGFNLAEAGEERQAEGYWVNGDFFRTLGVNAVLGRTLTIADDQRGCLGVAVVSHGFWQSQLGGDPAAIGRAITFNGKPFRIVGVVDPRFTGMDVGRRIDVFAPFCAMELMDGPGALDRRSTWYIRIVARPKPGLSLAQVRARLATASPAIFERTLPPNWASANKREYLTRRIGVVPSLEGLSFLRTSYERVLLTLMGMVVVVLLIACANVANLMLARATARQREMAVRVALGAGRGRLVRQLFTESLLLALAGGVLGIALAYWGARVLVSLITVFGESVFLDLPLDPRVLGFTLAVATGTALLFGLVPAWRAARVDPQAAMKAGGRGVLGAGGAVGAATRSRLLTGKSLVVLQVALSLVLVAGAGLLVGTFHTLSTESPGFRADGVLVVSANLRTPKSPERTAIAQQTQQRIIERLRAIPGVRSAAAAFTTPMSGSSWNDAPIVEGFKPSSFEEGEMMFNEVTDDWFETMEMRLVSGRLLDSRDVRGAPVAAVITEAAVRRFFQGRSPLGRTFRVPIGDRTSDPITIVGVVRDAKYRSMRETPPPTAFLSMRQDSTLGSGMTFVVRGAGSPLSLAGPVKAAIGEVAPKATMQLTTLEDQVGKALSSERLMAVLSGFFGVMALVLAMIGLYGIMAYSVARRRNEIGIRIALGAVRARVLRLVLGDVGRIVTIGVVLGLVAALAATRLVGSMLYGVRPNDPVTLAGAAALLLAVALLAGYLPARRAASVDPMEALREE